MQKMFQQILNTKKGKWAAVLAVLAVIAAAASVSEGSTEALPGALILLVIAGLLAASAMKSIQNPPPAPTLADQGIHVTQDDLDAFRDFGRLPVVQNSPVLLADGEQAVYACRAERVETKNRRLGTTGGGAGMSFRVAKGVNLRTGGAGSQSIYGDVEMVHEGEFVVTTERIVFVATSRSFEEKLSSLSAVSADNGSLAIMTSKESFTIRMPMPEYPCEIIKHCINAL